VVVQVALSLVLLAGAGLMAQTLRDLTGQQFGFRMEGAVVVDVNAGFGGYTPERLTSIYGEIDRRMRQLAGVRDVALALYSPMSGDTWQSPATLEERPRQRTLPAWTASAATSSTPSAPISYAAARSTSTTRPMRRTWRWSTRRLPTSTSATRIPSASASAWAASSIARIARSWV